MDASSRHVTILGAGLTGLVIAEQAARRGWRVTVLERENEPGGLCRSAQLGNLRVERYYHHVFPGERDIVALVRYAGLAGDFDWHPVRQGMLRHGRARSFDRLTDYWRENVASAGDAVAQVRFACRLLRTRDITALDSLTAVAWLRRYFSEPHVAALWRPLLTHKFGRHADRISAWWLADRLRERRSAKRWWPAGEVLGHLRGGFHRLTDRLADWCRRRDVQIECGVTVQQLTRRDGAVQAVVTSRGELPAGDVVVSTLPLPVVMSLTEPAAFDDWPDLRRLSYMGCLCVTLRLAKSLSPYYWISNLDATDFAAVIEHSKLLEGDDHVVYLPRYVAGDMPDRTAATADAVAWLAEVFPTFDAAWVIDHQVSWDPYSQPVFLAGYLQHRLQPFRPLANLWVTDPFMDYPSQTRSMNAAVRRAQQLAALLS